MTVYERALEFVRDGATIGLGSGRAASEFIKLLGAKVRSGLRVRCVPTSRKSADLAVSLGIPLVSLEEAMPLDLAALRGVDPGPVKALDELKAALAKR